MWIFVGNKANKQWLWVALNPANREVIAFDIGSRSGVDAQLFYDKIPEIFKGKSQSHKVGFFLIIIKHILMFLKMRLILE